MLCRPAVICRGGSAAAGHLRFWELLGVFWEFLREARRFSARFWLRLSAQQHPHLNRTRKSQLAISNTSATSAHLNRLSKSQLPSAIPGNPQHTSENISKFPKISQDLPRSPTQFFPVFQFSISTGKKQKSTVSAEYHSAVQHFFSFTMICGLHAQTKLFHSRNPPA